MRKISCEDCALRDRSIVGDLTDAELAAFRRCGVTVLYRRRQVIFHERSPAAGLYVLCQGQVKLYQSDRFGREHILGVAHPVDVLGELPADPQESYSVSAEAVTDVQVCFLPRERLIPFIREHPAVGVRLIGALSRALGAARQKVRELALKTAEGRLAALLLDLARTEARGDVATRFRLPYTRREIGEMIGVSPETAIRLLAALRRKRLIDLGGREVALLDGPRLRRLAAQDSVEGS